MVMLVDICLLWHGIDVKEYANIQKALQKRGGLSDRVPVTTHRLLTRCHVPAIPHTTLFFFWRHLMHIYIPHIYKIIFSKESCIPMCLKHITTNKKLEAFSDTYSIFTCSCKL